MHELVPTQVWLWARLNAAERLSSALRKGLDEFQRRHHSGTMVVDPGLKSACFAFPLHG